MANDDNLYAVLGVSNKATQAEIQAAFKKRARELHPDVNKAADAEEKFKHLVAAYEVLRDEEKRARYDAFGINGKAQSKKKSRSRPADPSFDFGFNDPRFDFDVNNPFDYVLRRQQKKRAKEREVQLGITVEQAYTGTTLSVTLETPTPAGGADQQRFKIKIPQGAKEGDRLKIKDPNVVVVLHVEPHPVFQLDGRDISTNLDIAPWEAALGAEVEILNPGGAAMKVKVPPGTSSGQKLRLRGLGLPIKPGKEGEPGDLYVRVKVVMPKNASDRAKELWRELAAISNFNPRS
jgi:curved DNA-binding protein